MECVTCYAFDSFYGSDPGQTVSSTEGLPSSSSLASLPTTPDKKIKSHVNKNTKSVTSGKACKETAEKAPNLYDTLLQNLLKKETSVNQNNSRKDTVGVQESFDSVRRNPSIVGKLIPSKVLMANGIEDSTSKNTGKAPRATKKSNRKRVIKDSKTKMPGRKGTSKRIRDKTSESSQIAKDSTKVGRKVQTKSGVYMKVKRGLSSSIKPIISSIKPKSKAVSPNTIKEMSRRRRSPLKNKELGLNVRKCKRHNSDKMSKTNKSLTQTHKKSVNSSKVLQNYPNLFETCIPVVKLSKSQIDKATSLKLSKCETDKAPSLTQFKSGTENATSFKLPKSQTDKATCLLSPIGHSENNLSNINQNIVSRDNKIQVTLWRSKKKWKKKDIPLKVVDSNFWKIPLNAFEGKMEYPEHFVYKVSDYFSYLLDDEVWSAIPEKFVQTALLFSNSNRTRFAMSLFQSVLSIGNVYQENAENFVVHKIQTWKMNLVRKETFKYFPAEHKCEDSEWKWIKAYLVHSLIQSAIGCVKKWFDTTSIKDKLQHSA